MTSAEFVEWQAYQRLVGPLGGPDRDDWRMAMIVATVANGNRDPKKRRRPFQPSEFIPDWASEAGVPPEEKPVDREAVAAKVKGFFQGIAERGRR